jgi:hypothetical protein
VSLAVGAAGIALLAWTGRLRRWIAPLLQLGCGFVVVVLLNPTYWAHTGIELLPWLSLTAGFVVASAVRATARGRNGRRSGGVPVSVCVGAAAALLVFAVPIRNLNWQAGEGSPYGFGYRDRAEIETVGRYVRDHSTPADPVVTPPILAFVANRRELVPYLELAGIVDELDEAVRQRGYVAALTESNLRYESFWAGVDASRAREAPAIHAAIQERRVAVVINDSPDDLMPFPLLDVARDTLAASRYSLEFVSAHYEVWLRR